VHRAIFALLGVLMVLATSMPAQAVPLSAPETDASGPATVSAASANVAASASSSAATVVPKERFFGAVQAIYNPDRAAEAGVQWERLIFPWALIQKNGPDSWSDGYFTDDQINKEVARGIDVVGVATYTPQWAAPDPKKAAPTNVPANLNLAFDDPHNWWGQYMYKLASRYKGKINTWVVWNEVDLYTQALRYTFDGNEDDYYQLVKVAYQAVKKANPDAKIALGGMTYWYDKLNGRVPYLERLLYLMQKDPTAVAHNEYFDIVTIHQYSNPLNIFAASEKFQEILDRYGLRKPIWIGESNVVPYDDPGHKIDKPLHATMDEQASYVIEAFALARAAHVARMSIYKMVDEAPEGPGELYGLVRNDGSTRPAYAAYKTAVKYFSDPSTAVYTWDGATEPPNDGQLNSLLSSNDHHPQWVWPAAVNRVTMEHDTQRVNVVWNGSPQKVTAKVPAAANGADVINKSGETIAHITPSNGVYSVDLAPTDNNTDPRDPSVYLVGGDPLIIVEQVKPLPTQIDAPVQVVWPINGAPIASTGQANVTAALLMPDSTQPVPCRWSPTVTLMASVVGQVGSPVAQGVKRMVTENGITYPVWDFPNVDVSAAKTADQWIEFWVTVDGVASVKPGYWVYGQGFPQPPSWPQKPRQSCT
jgi:hypothetical protein